MHTKTFYSLEILRFYAALVVFVGHYIHFPMFLKLEFSDSTLPIPMFLKAFGYGGLAVPTFFMISGIIFAHKYADRITNSEITFFEYLKKRFARLYPLHLLTLILVLLLTFAIKSFTDSEYFIYQHNDLKHFILHLFFMSHWGLEDGHSYNWPVWSVSNEVVFYIAFFVLLTIFKTQHLKNRFYMYILLFLMILQNFSITFSNPSLLLIQKNIFIFFLGSFLYDIIYKRTSSKTMFVILIFIGLYMFVPKVNKIILISGLTHGLLLVVVMSTILFLEKKNVFSKISHKRTLNSFLYLGSLSYSTYLIHVPIQMCIILIHENLFKLNFFSPYVFIIYTAVVLIFGRLIFVYIETPAKNFILNK